VVKQTTFFCKECNKNINIPRNIIKKLESNHISQDQAIKKAKERHNKKKHSLILGIKFKLYVKNKEDKEKLNSYFEEYAKAVTFAAQIIDKIKSGYLPQWKKDKKLKRIIFPKGKCDFCGTKTEIGWISKRGKKICKNCYSKEYGENGIRKKLYATRGRKVNPSYNIFNATKKLAATHYNYAIREAFQLLEANRKQRQERIRRLLRDKKRLREFEDLIEKPDRRIELPMKTRQREKRYIHISQKDKINELRGYTLHKIKEKIRILRRNTEREERALRKKTPIIFKGNRIMLFPQGIKFDKENNKVKITIAKNLPKEFIFSGTNVANKHGRRFFKEKLNLISQQKPKYAYLIRKQTKNSKKITDYDYYLQYTIETVYKIRKNYDGIIGIDRGINNLACLVLLEKNQEKPCGVKFYKGKEINALKIKRRKQLYFLRRKHNRKQKQKRIRRIEPKINQILHIISKEIVELAKEKNFAIGLEQLEKPKKSRFRQRRKERYFLSLFNFKTLSTFIEYKAKKEGIRVIYIPPERTSQICSHCAIKGDVHTNTIRPYRKPNAKKSSSSLFKCKKCGVELNADYNAAFNIAQKSLKILST